jgi:ABC-type bacteriocin/lantibiotic exporter with double-glycine peptidase domain
MGMWQSYKKRIIPSQVFVAICVVIYAVVTGHWDWQRLLFVFLVLEAFTLLGAWSGARLERIAERDAQRNAKRDAR